MAEMLGSVVAEETLKQVMSVLIGKQSETAEQHVERLEMAQIKLEAVGAQPCSATTANRDEQSSAGGSTVNSLFRRSPARNLVRNRRTSSHSSSPNRSLDELTHTRDEFVSAGGRR